MTKIDLIFETLSDTDCEELIKNSEEHLIRSQVVNVETGESYVDNARTSSNYYIEKNNFYIQKIIKRIVSEYGVREGQFEAFCILKYTKGQEYVPHFDWFDPSFEGNLKHLERGGQRIYTVLTYLSEGFEGGETNFPKLNISLKPKKGTTIVFRSFNEDKQLYKNTLHSALPVKDGIKYVVVSFIREEDFI